MIGWIGNLFSSNKVADDVFDKDSGLLAKAGGWIGNMNFTEEEKAEHGLKVRDWGLKQLEALHPFKVMQRIMVTIIMVEWAILANVMIVAICLKADTVVQNLLAFSQTEFMWMPVAGAVGLYLFGGVMPTRKGS